MKKNLLLLLLAAAMYSTSWAIDKVVADYDGIAPKSDTA
jgi:hypothetical protein